MGRTFLSILNKSRDYVFHVDCDSEDLKRTSPKTENIPHTYIKRPKPLASSALRDQCGSLKDFGDLIMKKKIKTLRGLFPHIKSGVPRDYFANPQVAEGFADKPQGFSGFKEQHHLFKGIAEASP